MEIKIKCERKNCEYCQDGWCICQELIFETTTPRLSDPSPGGARDYYATVFSCGSYKLKSK